MESIQYSTALAISGAIKVSSRKKNLLRVSPAKIYWSPRRREDVFKTCLEGIFQVTIFRLPRRLGKRKN